MPKFQIIVDTREQRPYKFQKIKPKPTIITDTLKTGDYSIFGYEDQFCIERKSLPDLFGSMGKGRKRFEKEFDRMSKMRFAVLMIESSYINMFRNPPIYSRMNPKAVYRSVIAWEIRYGVHVHWSENRAFAEAETYILIENFWKGHRKNGE